MRIFLCLSLISLFASASEWSDELKLKIDKNVRDLFDKKTQVGISIGIIKNDERHIWNYGKRIIEIPETPTENTFFEVASITKTFTASLLALEVTRGRVNLDDPVKKLWPELTGTDAGEITLTELATHHSGLPRSPENYSAGYDSRQLYKFLKNYKQTAARPYPFVYSNLGMGLLGYLLSEKLNGKDYSTYINQNILGPLGLTDTKLVLTDSDFNRAAQGYNSSLKPTSISSPTILAGAGALKSTVADLLNYAQANINLTAGDLGNAFNLAHQPIDSTDVAATKIGLAWMNYPIGSHSVIAHSGVAEGFRANLIIDLKEHIIAVALSNAGTNQGCLLLPVFDEPCDISKAPLAK